MVNILGEELIGNCWSYYIRIIFNFLKFTGRVRERVSRGGTEGENLNQIPHLVLSPAPGSILHS